ncbi:uncharacterized protein LOC110712231 [Chenopodium quinoa]|uniref:uncharacterized protein LOC110712231 n=1 Tax=Chenopodium quinoa TaxID=63459 RepID=UPI000B772F03|nr:uncharacterized protein LOC110712231 [Chenopodium quinoa]
MKQTWTWQTLEVPTLMLISLVIQALLALLAPLRKNSANGYLLAFLWLLYLSADSVALLVIGLISRSHQSDDNPSADIVAFWAPFLLLHLGGPDTITALAFEDNELWHRHALQLITQTMVTLYVFVLSMVRGRHNRLWLPMALMFIDGFIKYVERTFALYFASREGIRASLGEEPISSFNRWADEYYSAETSNIPSRFEVVYIRSNVDDTNDDSDLNKANVEENVNHAYTLYNSFRGILADDVSTLTDEHMLVEMLFLKQHVLKGIEIILTELNLFYDVLHTKVFLASKKRGFLRLVCFLSLITASLLFFFAIRSNTKYYSLDVGVSFTLLGGAIVLDIVSFLRFLHSDWFVITVTKVTAANPSRLLPFQNVLSVLLKWSIRWKDPYAKRWCQSTSSYNLLNCSFKRKAFNFLDFIYIKRIKDCLIDWLYVERNPIKLSYLEFIFTELQLKAKLVRGDKEGMEQVSSARGNLVLEEDFFLVSEYLQPWTIDVEDYSESVLTWHLATDICYWIESNTTCEPHREVSKQLSDYVVYLILRRQDLVPQLVSKSDVHFKSTEKDIILAYDKASKNTRDPVKSFCEYVVYHKLDDRIAAQVSKSNDSQSVFDEACCLAKQLVMFGDNKWEIISKVWVEMLCYAAIRSSPRYNFANLSKGGELITLVWLFMSHLGYRLPLPENRGLRSAKLIIGK